jgi:SAM-dependent methyltransferase
MDEPAGPASGLRCKMGRMAEFSYGERLLGEFGGPEQERVSLLASVYDPATFALLESIGVASGWRCLDAGAGAGSVARWLAARAAPAVVIAADRDVRFLGNPAEPNLMISELDLTTASLPEAAFDLIIARIVLLHLPSRDAVLSHLCQALAPGGYLVIGETVPDLGLNSPYPEIRACLQAMTQIMTTTLGTDFTWVRTLPAKLAALGLTNIGIRADTPPVTGGDTAARGIVMTLDAVSDTMIQRGVLDQDTVTRATARLIDPAYTDLTLTLIHTWGRRLATR